MKLFLHIDRPYVNDRTTANRIMCGKIADIEGTYYSSSSNLIFEFHTDWKNSSSLGFRGTFRFLDKSESSFPKFPPKCFEKTSL